MTKQRILTPPFGDILQCLIDVQRNNERIVSVAPHYDYVTKQLSGYIVIVEPQVEPSD